MKKHILLPVLAAALLCASAVTLASCDKDVDPQETETDTTVVTDAATEDDTAAATEDESESEAQSETETDAADTAAESKEETAETAEETLPETDGETEGETESETDGETETELPRFDYDAADVAKDVTMDKSVYAEMALTLPSSLQVTDEDVVDYIDYLRFQYRKKSGEGAQVTDQALRSGDDAYIYYKGFLDGKEFDGGSNWESETPYALGLGSGSFIPGFEEGLVGLVPNTTSKDDPFELNVTFPADYDNGTLAGKAVVFHVVVVYAVQYDLPAYDLDFIENTLYYEYEKEFYASDTARFKEFEAFIRTYLEDSMASDLADAKADALWTYLVENATCQNLPAEEVNYYKQTYIAEIEYYYETYSYYYGEDFTKEYPDLAAFAIAYMGFESGADWQAELTAMAERIVKRDMIVHAIAEWESMESVTEAEFEAEVQYWVDYYSSYGVTREDVIEEMGEDALRESAFYKKMENWLMDRTTFAFETADGETEEGTGSGEDTAA